MPSPLHPLQPPCLTWPDGPHCWQHRHHRRSLCQHQASPWGPQGCSKGDRGGDRPYGEQKLQPGEFPDRTGARGERQLPEVTLVYAFCFSQLNWSVAAGLPAPEMRDGRSLSKPITCPALILYSYHRARPQLCPDKRLVIFYLLIFDVSVLWAASHAARSFISICSHPLPAPNFQPEPRR